MADKMATLHLLERAVELRNLSGTVGPIVCSKLGTRMFTLRPQPRPRSYQIFITYIDGDQGVLLHRGYPIAQLATQASHLEVRYILLYGEAPTKTQYAEFERGLRHTMVHGSPSSSRFPPRRPPHGRHASGVVSALSAFYHDAP